MCHFPVVARVIQLHVCGLFPKKSIYASVFSVLQLSAELVVTNLNNLFIFLVYNTMEITITLMLFDE